MKTTHERFLSSPPRQGGEGRGSGHHSLSEGPHSSQEHFSCPQKESQTIPNPMDTRKDFFPSALQQCHQTPHIFPVNSQTKSIFFSPSPGDLKLWRFKVSERYFFSGKSHVGSSSQHGDKRNDFVHLSSVLLLFQPNVASNNFPTWSRGCFFH